MNAFSVSLLLFVFFIPVSYQEGNPNSGDAETKDKTGVEKPAPTTEDVDKKDTSPKPSAKEKGVETKDKTGAEKPAPTTEDVDKKDTSPPPSAKEKGVETRSPFDSGEEKKVKPVEKDGGKAATADAVDEKESKSMTEGPSKVTDSPKKDKKLEGAAADGTSEVLRKDLMKDTRVDSSPGKPHKNHRTHPRDDESDDSESVPPKKTAGAANDVNEPPHHAETRAGKLNSISKEAKPSTNSRFHRFTKFLKNMDKNLGEKLDRLDDTLTDYTHRGMDRAGDRIYNTKQAIKDRLGIVEDSSSGSGEYNKDGYRKSDLTPDGGLAF